MVGEADSSVADDSVSEHEELVSMFSTTESSGAGFVVFLDKEGSKKGLGSPWKGRSIFLCRSVNLPLEFSFSTLNTGTSGMAVT